MADTNLVQIKHCPKCNLTKAETEFRIRTDNGKRRNMCDKCWSERCKLYNSRRDPEQTRANARAYYHRKIKDCPAYAERRRAYKVAKLYGLTREEYNHLRAVFNNRCGICGKGAERQYLAVDHCHDTGVVRGLLCRPCNMGLGKLGDSIEGLERAISYLKRNWREKIAA